MFEQKYMRTILIGVGLVALACFALIALNQPSPTDASFITPPARQPTPRPPAPLTMTMTQMMTMP